MAAKPQVSAEFRKEVARLENDYTRWKFFVEWLKAEVEDRETALDYANTDYEAALQCADDLCEEIKSSMRMDDDRYDIDQQASDLSDRYEDCEAARFDVRESEEELEKSLAKLSYAKAVTPPKKTAKKKTTKRKASR